MARKTKTRPPLDWVGSTTHYLARVRGTARVYMIRPDRVLGSAEVRPSLVFYAYGFGQGAEGLPIPANAKWDKAGIEAVKNSAQRHYEEYRA